MRIYLDTCCVNRLTDDHSQERVRLEAQAIISLLDFHDQGRVECISSDYIISELLRNPDTEKRAVALRAAKRLLRIASGTPELVRVRHLNSLGMSFGDAMHSSCAESALADVVLTTDDKFVRQARRMGVRVNVQNPLSWWEEYERDRHQ